MTTFQKRIKVRALLLLALLATPYHAFATVVGFTQVGFDMDIYNVAPGETFDVSIVVSNFPGINLAGGGVVLDRTNPMLIGANSVMSADRVCIRNRLQIRATSTNSSSSVVDRLSIARSISAPRS